MRISDWSSDVCSSDLNDTPESASRPYDTARDGFVIAGGGGMLVLEEYEHAKARGARIHAELAGYGVTSDGVDMVAPSGEGVVRCMRMAMNGLDAPIDYLNTHGTSTPLGDIVELEAVREAFRSEEHTSELQSLMRISYAVFCLTKKNKTMQNES